MSLAPTEKLVHATLVYIIKDGKTLMIHRVGRENDIHREKYNGLGGKLEENETPSECAIREIQEESGLTIHPKDMKLYGTALFPEFDKKGRDWFVFIYKVYDYSGELIVENREGRLEWIENEKILDLNLWDGDRYFLEHLHSDQQFDGSLTYQNGGLTHQRSHLLRGT